MLDTKIIQERSVNTLRLTNRCRILLEKFSTYINNCEPSKEIDSLPQIIKNSLPSCEDQEEAALLVKELLEYDKLVYEFYDSVVDTYPK